MMLSTSPGTTIVVTASWECICCREGFHCPPYQTSDQCTMGLQRSSYGPFRWGVHNGEVSFTEGWINVAWRGEFPAHFPFWLPHHIQLLNSLLCVINLFLPPQHHRCITVYALRIKPRCHWDFGMGSMLRQYLCVVRGIRGYPRGNAFHLLCCQEGLSQQDAAWCATCVLTYKQLSG